MITLALVSSFIAVFAVVSSDLKESISFAAREENALFKADFLLKNCFPEGIALCNEKFAYSHAADSRAALVFAGSGVCVKRIVVQSGEFKVLKACG